MKTTVRSNTKDAQNPASSSQRVLPSPQSGRLAQLAAIMNQGPRVQAQLKLADEIQNSEPVQRQLALAAQMNHAPVAQPRLKEEKPAQREEAPTPNRTGLPDQLKAGAENLSGISLDDVKVHYNSAKPAQLNALAYAQGTDIHVAAGQEKHLPHEAWHIVQQKQGRVKPTMQMKVGVPVNDDPGLEKEADVMGTRALVVSQREVQRMPAAQHEVVQRTLKISSGQGKFTYFFGADFMRDHIGGQDDAIATLRSRWNSDRITSPVTVIPELDGDHNATDVTPKSPYQFALAIDVNGYTASWNENNKAVAVPVSSVVLSGYIQASGDGRITHISASD